MTFTANVTFTACGRYTQPRSFPVLNTGRFEQDDAIIDNLLNPLEVFNHRVPSIHGGWDAERFNFTLDIKFPSNRSYSTDGILLHGHTSPGAGVVPDLRLYFDRIIGYAEVTMMAAGGIPEVHTRLRYDSHIASPQPTDESEIPAMKYLLDYPTVMRYAASEVSFAPFRRDNDVVKNLCGQLRSPVAYCTDDLSPNHFGEMLRDTVLDYTNASMGLDAEPADLYMLGVDLSRSVRLDDTRFFQTLSQQTNYRHDSYITYEELTGLLSSDSPVVINFPTDATSEQTTPSSPQGERIFMDLARWAIVSASSEGVRTGNAVVDCDPTDVDGKMTICYDKRLFKDFDNGDGDDYEIDPATEAAGSKLLPQRTLTLAKLYNVGYFNADIDFDVFGDIVGSVTISGRGTERFRIPAWFFGSFGGLVGTEQQMDSLSSMTKMIVDTAVLKTSEV